MYLLPFIKSRPWPANYVLVVAMYTKASYRGAKHEAISRVESVGLPSNIYVQVLSPLFGNVFTSLSCNTLSCNSYLQIHRSHIIFSLASYNITLQEVSSLDTHPFTLATLPPDAAKIWTSLQSLLAQVSGSVAQLQKLSSSSRKKNPTAKASSLRNGGADDADGDSAISDSDASDGPDD